MLVLTRKKNESIVIGPDIEIVVAAIRGKQVKLGITAPKNVSIYRSELIGAPVDSLRYQVMLRGLNVHSNIF